MNELSEKVLSVIRSNGNKRVSENVLSAQFSQKEINIALSELKKKRTCECRMSICQQSY